MHYLTDGKPYFAVGFPNRSGGYEIRNKFFKGCIAPKDITHIRQTEPGETCCLFEGFMDYLSFLTLRQERHPDRPPLGGQDHIVLNSVSNFSKALRPLGDYERIHCFLDNDRAGLEALREIQREYGSRVRDASYVYSGYKDLNDYLNGKKIVTAGEPGTADKASTVGAAAGQEKRGRASECNRTYPAGFCTVKSHSSIGRFLHAAQAQLKTPY